MCRRAPSERFSRSGARWPCSSLMSMDRLEADGGGDTHLRGEPSGTMFVSSRALSVLLAAALAALSGSPSMVSSQQLHRHGAGSAGLHAASVSVVPAGDPGPVPAREAETWTVAFRPSGRTVTPGGPRKGPRVELFQTGTNAIEPTMGIDAEGRIFFIGLDGQQWPVFPTQTMRSTDQGKTWDDVTPAAPQDHPTTEDPYIYVDKDTGRVFTSDFMAPCTAISRSDDAGETWQTSVAACDLFDHQTIFSGTPVTSPTTGYPNIVYYCAVDNASGPGVSCLKSIDGGQTFVRTGQPALTEPARAAQCGWGSGHGVVGPEGVVYLPAGVCGRPTLAISHDEGLTWERIEVADMDMGNDGRADHDAAVAVDDENNLYYSWTGADLRPYLSVSIDGGSSWSKPVMIAPPGVKIATLIALDVASPGNVAVSFVGSETRSEFGEGEYSGYMMMTTNALARDPLFHAGRVNPASDPIDGGCDTGSCSTNREFLDVAIAPDGTVWATFADGCYDDLCGHFDKPFVGIAIGRGLVGHLVGGPRLR